MFELGYTTIIVSSLRLKFVFPWIVVCSSILHLLRHTPHCKLNLQYCTLHTTRLYTAHSTCNHIPWNTNIQQFKLHESIAVSPFAPGLQEVCLGLGPPQANQQNWGKLVSLLYEKRGILKSTKFGHL